MTSLHPLIPTDFVNNLEFLLDELKTDLGFKNFDDKSSPEIFQSLNILYFFALGTKINELDPTKSTTYNLDLIYQLNQEGLITTKPKNLDELKNTYTKIFEKTSEYLKKID